MVPDAGGHVSEIGSKADLDAFGEEREAYGISGIVRDRKGRDVDIANAEFLPGTEMLGLRKLGRLPFLVADGAIPGVMRGLREKDWHLEFSGQALESGNVVRMLMRDEDGGKLIGACIDQSA